MEQFDRDTIERTIRERVRDIIEQVVAAELDAALGAKPSQRVGEERKGYRNGYHERTLTTSTGPTPFSMPRARLRGGGGHRLRKLRICGFGTLNNQRPLFPSRRGFDPSARVLDCAICGVADDLYVCVGEREAKVR